MSRAKWLRECSTEAVKEAIGQACPRFADAEVRLRSYPWSSGNNPLWFRGTAFLDDQWVIKFAWSEEAALKLECEVQILRTLAQARRPPPLPEIIVDVLDPVLLVYRFVPGSPITYEAIAGYSPHERGELARSLAEVLAALHDPEIQEAMSTMGNRLGAPVPQADTPTLRERLCPHLSCGQADMVRRWCGWVDERLAQPGPKVFLHGDFHGMNLVASGRTVRAVLDFEEAAMGDRSYDFRYLPAQAPTLQLLLETAAAYKHNTKINVDLHRVMAWHIRTVLGDALGRTEAEVPLPGGGTPETWIEGIEERLIALQSGPDHLPR